MRGIIAVIFSLLLSACAVGADVGGEFIATDAWKTLPATVCILDQGLEQQTREAVDFLNNNFGELFAIVEDCENAKVTIDYDRSVAVSINVAGEEISYSVDGVMLRSEIIIRKICRYQVANIVHELIHALGFSGHVNDESCIMYYMGGSEPISEDRLCDEVIDAIATTYPDAMSE